VDRGAATATRVYVGVANGGLSISRNTGIRWPRLSHLAREIVSDRVMSFLPIGPDFVFTPRVAGFVRMSARNELGAQGLVSQIAIDPTDPNHLYVLVRPSSGGANVFHSDDGGASWTAITDVLLVKYAGQASVSAVGINQVNPYVYIGTDSGNVFVSPDRGSTWSLPIPTGGGSIWQLLVDPRTASDPINTNILAATSQGVFHSLDGGATWISRLAGDARAIAAWFPPAGAPDYYAAIDFTGLFHTTDPTQPWKNLNDGTLLPAWNANSYPFVTLAVDVARSPARRAYVIAAQSGKTLGLYTSADPLKPWTQVQSPSLPNPGQGLYSFGLAVAPNSPGDAVNDVLFFPGWHFYRSVDAGQTWIDASSGQPSFHDDLHCVAFSPDPAPPGTVPSTYFGCDGGLAMSDQFADPTFLIQAPQTDYNQSATYVDTGIAQNLNHGLQSCAIYNYSSDPSVPALSYISCQDTGLAGGTGTLGWRVIADQYNIDGFNVAVSPGADGVKVWSYLGSPNYIRLATDRGAFNSPDIDVKLAGELLVATSNFVVGLDKALVCGVWVRDDGGPKLNMLQVDIPAPGMQAATPLTMQGISVGTDIVVDAAANAEVVKVTAITNVTFTATFTKAHQAGAVLRLQRHPVVRIDGNGLASQISQDFGQGVEVKLVARSPIDPNVLFCATSDQRLWTTNNGVMANAQTIWNEVVGSKPAAPQISSITVDSIGVPYVMCADAVATGAGEFVFQTPLFSIQGGNWIGQSCQNLPGGIYGKILADPLNADRLYVVRSSQAFQLVNSQGAWHWTDISDGLPGAPLYDSWIGNIGSANAPRILLRVAASSRGVFEREVTPGAPPPPKIQLYLRANFLDLALLDTCPSGVPNPFDPQNPDSFVYHYQCADIKVDAENSGGFFQNEPEDPLPISHTTFDQINDNSVAVPESGATLVHVQVHNRSRTAASAVRVWALYCNASAGVPALNATPSGGNGFAFWQQFKPNGQIIAQLPSDSPWKPVGSPQILSGISVDSPKVASWNWTAPKLANGDRGHYCIAAFVHSAASLLNDISMDVDDLASRKKLVGLKNLHIGPPLPPNGSGGGGPQGSPGTGAPADGSPPAGRWQMREYVEFHNPTSVVRPCDLVFDFSNLPAQIEVAIRLSHLHTSHGLPTPEHSTSSPKDNNASAIRSEELSEKRRRGRPTLPLHPPIYRPSGRGERRQVRVREVQLEPYGACAAGVYLRNTGRLTAATKFFFQVQQVVAGHVVGGCMYEVRIAGRAKYHKLRPPATELPGDAALRNLPVWAAGQIEAEIVRQGKGD